MKLTKTYHSILYILAFNYLVMCPSVHQLWDIIRHDVTFKIGFQTQQKNLKKNFNSSHFKFSFSTQPTDCDYLKKVFFIETTPSSPLTLNLSFLSTVRLIL